MKKIEVINQLEEELRWGRMSRRQFLARASALGVAAMLSPAMMGGDRAQAALPKKGGRFRIGLGDFATTDSLDPTLIETRMQMHLNWQVRNNLVEVGPGGRLVPELAESWEATPDAKTWTFHLRRGVEFHNGKSFDADDVLYSISLHTKKDTKSVAKAFVAKIREMRKVDKHQVAFVLESGDVDFPAIMTLYALPIVPAGSKDFDRGMGTGPYVLKYFEPGVRALVQRNPNYWKSGRGHFDEIETLGIADVTARTNALMTGKIDAMNFVDLKTVHHLEKRNDIQVIKVHGKMHYPYPMRMDMYPFNNNNVRLALKYAIDREEVLRLILRGYGTLGNDHPLSPAYRYFASELPQRQYDPDKARFHMKKAGIGEYTFKIHASDLTFNGAVDTVLLYSQHAARAGIKIEAVREPEDGYWSNVWRKKPWCSSRWAGRITEDIMLSTAYGAESTWNETYFNHPRFEKLLKAARTEFDEAKRREMYVEMQRIIRDEGGAVIPVFADFVDAASAKVKFGELSSDWDLDGARCGERWWFGA